jgi:hypothetical protein
MNKVVIFLLMCLALLSGCKEENQIICACYIFPTMSYVRHCYIEVEKSGVMTFSYGMGSDIAMEKIETKEPMEFGTSKFISSKSYYQNEFLEDSTDELVGRHLVKPYTCKLKLSDKELQEILALKKKIKVKDKFYDGLDKDAMAAILMVNGHTCSGYYTDYPKNVQDSLVKLLVRLSPITTLSGFGGYIEYDHNIKRERLAK